MWVNSKFKLKILRTLIVGVPSLSVAFLTGDMHFTVPTIAMTILIAEAVNEEEVASNRQIDDEGSNNQSSFLDSTDGGL